MGFGHIDFLICKNEFSRKEYMNMFEVSSLPKPKFVLLVAVITVFVTYFGLPAFSQTKEFQSITAVEFNDGSMIEGSIIEMNASIIKIQKPDGTIEVRKFSDAKSFIKFGEAKPIIGETISAETSPTGMPLRRNTFELAPEISYRVYKEPDANVKIKGIMYGLVGSYTYHDKIMWKVEGIANWGQVDYSSDLSGQADNITDYMLEIRFLAGYDFVISRTSVITPYIGIGYRYLNDDGSGKTSTKGDRGYERESNYIYSPIGIEIITNLGNNWSIGEIVEFDYFWWGKQKTHFSDVSPDLPDVENRQTDGYGLRGSITIEKKYKEVAFEGGPFVRYWNIKRSDNEYFGPIYVYEPDNNSTEVGIKFGVRF